MPNQPDLETLFEGVYNKLSSSEFGKNLGGELPLFIQPVPSERQMDVESQIKRPCTRLKKKVIELVSINLYDYLYKNFYADHQQMYSVKGAKPPIYWMFSSQMGDKKKKGYFKALVYMHRMEADTLSKLYADYVYPYLQKIEQQLVEAEDNATSDDISQAQYNKALKVADELREKVRDVKTFETALVEMASARITIDLDDGVKANYPKFNPPVEPIKGLDKSED